MARMKYEGSEFQPVTFTCGLLADLIICSNVWCVVSATAVECTVQVVPASFQNTHKHFSKEINAI